MDSLLSKITWMMIDLPPGSKSIILSVYLDKNIIEREPSKVRLVTKGFRQQEMIYYFDIYALLARITPIRVVIAMASTFILYVHQMNVKTTFLNGVLNVEVKTEQHEKFILAKNENR